MNVRNWFRVEAVADDPSTVDILVYDMIGDWIDDYLDRAYPPALYVTGKSFVDQLAQLSADVKNIRVHINSPGGDVFGAQTIASALRDQQASKGRTVETIIEGLAASAASIIAMAGSKVTMADNALMMIHNPSTIALGEAKDLRQAAAELDTIRNTIVATYKWHSNLDGPAIVAMLDATTWMDADEAIAKGFATNKVEGLKAVASIAPGAFKTLNVPERFKDRVSAFMKTATPAPVAMAEAEVLRVCEEGGCDIAFARALITAKATETDVKARIQSEKTRKADATQRTDAITTLCKNSKVPQLADGYIAGGMTVDQVRAHLTNITALLDKAEVDAGLEPSHGEEQIAASWKRSMGRAGRSRGR